MPGRPNLFSLSRLTPISRTLAGTAHPNAVRFEYVLPDKTKADYVLCDRHGRALAVIEAKRAVINPAETEAQAKAYQCWHL